MDEVVFHFTGIEYICEACTPDNTHPKIMSSYAPSVGCTYETSLFADYFYRGALRRLDAIMKIANECDVDLKMEGSNNKWIGHCTKNENGDLLLTTQSDRNWDYALNRTKCFDATSWELTWRFYGPASKFAVYGETTARLDRAPIHMTFHSTMTLNSLTNLMLDLHATKKSQE